MAVILSPDGPQNIKIPPYLVALVRWCVSCVWSTATVVLHRLITNRLPPLPAIKPASKTRAASSDHLHPEPKVECEVLHQPAHHGLDVIFVHGLYGSLANTWRQGEWRSKHSSDLNKVTLKEEKNTCTCHTIQLNSTDTNDKQITVRNITEDDELINENFYNKSLKEHVEIVDYETQAMFVRDLFEQKEMDECIYDVRRDKHEDCKCKKQCEVGCGCVCDDCYSACWPRDWIKADYPEARVISINYTSDPHLWRPLWIKENKRLKLHERAEQMTQQLLDLGVGEKPIIWVGHSKGGLFIKQIYCEAYEAYLNEKAASENKNAEEYNIDNELNHLKDIDDNIDQSIDNTDDLTEAIIDHMKDNDDVFDQVTNFNDGQDDIKINNLQDIDDTNEQSLNSTGINIEDKNGDTNLTDMDSDVIMEEDNVMSSKKEEDTRRSTLWSNSFGFMFYSVPHRGSPLADIKTPLTARSVELTEICKDCPLVLSLQERWLEATGKSRAHVVSLVETCRTLMSVLWLTIVTQHSADAGVGTLGGVSVDHRDICKPSSRQCLLYTELMDLIRSALYRCQCQRVTVKNDS